MKKFSKTKNKIKTNWNVGVLFMLVVIVVNALLIFSVQAMYVVIQVEKADTRVLRPFLKVEPPHASSVKKAKRC